MGGVVFAAQLGGFGFTNFFPFVLKVTAWLAFDVHKIEVFILQHVCNYAIACL